MNVLNGGAHAENNPDIQEFMIVPEELRVSAQPLRIASDTFHTLVKPLEARGFDMLYRERAQFCR